MRTFMRRFAMSLNALAMAAAGAVHALSRRDAGSAGLAAALLLWAVAELFVALFRSYEGVVPRDRAVSIARMLWLLSAVYAWVDARTGWTRVEVPEAWALAAAGLMAAGAALRFWAVVELGRSFSYDVKRPAGGEVVRSGPYRWIRHPAYLGLCLASVPLGLALGSLPGLGGLGASTLVATVRRIQAEERLLDEELGESWRAYARETWRMVPFVY